MITKYFGVGAVVLLLVGWGIAPAAASYLIGDWLRGKIRCLGQRRGCLETSLSLWNINCRGEHLRPIERRGHSRRYRLHPPRREEHIRDHNGPARPDGSASDTAYVNGGSGTYYLQILQE